jgi:NAD(P)-dependent dehydrogenase (short-subunit alcohol dehydrogenase family)
VSQRRKEAVVAISELKGKRVFITGAGSGIGEATAIAFAREGCEVFISDLSLQALRNTERAIMACEGRCHSFALDVTDGVGFEELAGRITEEFGAPHVVINNAGIGAHGSFLNTPMDVARRVIEVNLFGVYSGCRAFLPAMLDSGEPCHLVNVASLASIAPMPNMSAYAASKYAVDGLTEVLALELAGSNVDVTCVHPGVINTPIANGNSFNGEEGESQTRRLGAHYRAHGSDPDVVARGIVDAVREGRAHLWVGSQAGITEKLKRLSPRLLRRISLRKAQEIGYA